MRTTTIGVVFAPHAIGADGPSPSPIPQGCQLRSPQPEAPLELNVVAAGELIKTIAVEKEIFNCYDAKSNLASVKDVETLVETVERGVVSKDGRRSSSHGRRKDKPPTLTTVAKSAEADTCTKDLQTGGISCTSQAVPLGATTTPVARCSVTKGTYPFDPVQQPTHPIGMRTASLDGGLVETVTVEKEIFDCAGRIGDLYLFHRNVELAGKTGFQAVATRFDGFICLKNEATAQLTQCKVFTPSRPG